MTAIEKPFLFVTTQLQISRKEYVESLGRHDFGKVPFAKFRPANWQNIRDVDRVSISVFKVTRIIKLVDDKVGKRAPSIVTPACPDGKFIGA